MRVIALFLGLCLLSIRQEAKAQVNLEKRIGLTHIETEDTLVFGRPTFTPLPTAQIAQWKEGYVVFYVNSQWQSKYFFTDASFKKTTKEYTVANRVVFQVVTDNAEIALLAGDKSGTSGWPRADFAFFMKVSEQGEVLMERKIVGAENVKKGNATELDDWGNFHMRWTGDLYVTFFPIQHNFRKVGPADVHQGDCLYFIQPDGKVLAYDDWGSSHSFEQRIVVGDKCIATAAKGDAYPRGIAVNMIHKTGYDIKPFGKGSKDMNNPNITHYLDEENSFSNTPLKVSGKTGENYVPFSLGDIVLLDSVSTLVSFSSKDKKAYHDVGIVRSHHSGSSKPKYLTNTSTLVEHSVRMAVLDENRILIGWKEFNPKTSNSTIKSLRKSLGSWPTDDAIYKEHNVDRHKMAIIDSTGAFVVKPQKVADVNWYYTAGLMERSSTWHSVINSYANHCYSPFFNTYSGALAWAYHGHESKTIQVYTYTD